VRTLSSPHSFDRPVKLAGEVAVRRVDATPDRVVGNPEHPSRPPLADLVDVEPDGDPTVEPDADGHPTTHAVIARDYDVRDDGDDADDISF
jgi:hypothetical protein